VKITRKIILNRKTMAADEMFDSVTNSTGVYAGVFEYDGEVGYFYLYEMKGNEGKKVVAAIRILIGAPDFDEDDVAICWSSTEERVGLFIHNQLWAVFDCATGARCGGNYRAGTQPAISSELRNSF
jgi:hypothetical protein